VRSIPVKPDSPAEVPMGFYESAQTLMSTQEYIDILDLIKNASKNGDDFEVLITGHSLGGATATTVKAELEDSLPEIDKTKIKAITFGTSHCYSY
jgi:alpha-beta hydrolase superfamily lysophospholipase